VYGLWLGSDYFVVKGPTIHACGTHAREKNLGMLIDVDVCHDESTTDIRERLILPIVLSLNMHRPIYCAPFILSDDKDTFETICLNGLFIY
jgi:hypothetical protein